MDADLGSLAAPAKGIAVGWSMANLEAANTMTVGLEDTIGGAVGKPGSHFCLCKSLLPLQWRRYWGMDQKSVAC